MLLTWDSHIKNMEDIYVSAQPSPYLGHWYNKTILEQTGESLKQ